MLKSDKMVIHLCPFPHKVKDLVEFDVKEVVGIGVMQCIQHTMWSGEHNILLETNLITETKSPKW